MSSHEVPSTAANRMAAPGNDLLEKLGDLMLRQRPPIFNVVFSVVCLVGAIFLRFAVDLYLPPGFPFLTFFPAVLLAAVFAGVRAGIVVAVLSGLAAWYYFLPPVNSLELSANTAVAMGFYTLIVATELVLIAATKQAHARLKGANERSSHLARSRELMFNELQHRVSNNLATVAALLRMQAGRTLDEGARQSLSEAQVRIGTISRLQRRLHSPNIQSVDAGIFLRDIADDSMEAAGSDGDRVLLDLQSVLLPHERAIPLGLIVSELLMNAVEHGRPDPTRQLTLSLRTQAIPNDTEHLRVTIRVRDRGPGVPEDFRVENSTSLGLGIARQFAAQLGGTLDITNAPDGGAVAELVFDTPIPV